MEKMIKVAIVDDDPTCRLLGGIVLRRSGFASEAFENAEHFLESFDHCQWDCILLDIKMPGMSGSDLQDQLAARRLRIPIIFISREADIPTAEALHLAGAYDVISKPIDPAALIATVHHAVSLARA